MARNVLILRSNEGVATWIARVAAGAGEDLGLVRTAIGDEAERFSGGRIEGDHEYGGHVFSALDEPVYIGSAVTQLAGHADAVVVDSVDGWATRLHDRLGADLRAIDAEIVSLSSIADARMADLILVSRHPDAREDPVEKILSDIHAALDSRLDVIVDLRGASPRLLRGSLPAGAE